jgi:hypothetical protein
MKVRGFRSAIWAFLLMIGKAQRASGRAGKNGHQLTAEDKNGDIKTVKAGTDYGL